MKIGNLFQGILSLTAVTLLFLVWAGLTALPVWVVYNDDVKPLEKKVEVLQKIVANDGLLLKEKGEQIETLRVATNTYLGENETMRLALMAINAETNDGNFGCVDRLIEIRRLATESLRGSSNSENGP